MQIIKRFFKLLIFIFPLQSNAQSTYLPKGSLEYEYLDRVEILNGNNSSINFSTVKPYNRKSIMDQFFFSDSNTNKILIISEEELKLKKNNLEWLGKEAKYYTSKKSLFHTFYKNPASFYEVNNESFFLSVNPILHFRYGKEINYDKPIFLNTRGVTIRGRIANKIGFSSTITDNQERGPQFYQQEIKDLRALPGNGFYKVFKKDLTAYDYFDGRGYFTFNAAKFIDFQVGYDKNFIGNGYRSLFLSDWGNSYLFAKINTKIWKLNYQNLFMELMPQFIKRGDSLLPRKYAAMHHLSINATKWLNIGLFEGVIFGRKDHFEFQYLNPIIFYRHIEGAIGSPDNALAGLDFKANALHHFQFYGQMIFDEFILSKIKNQPTFWANKFGVQLGAKYINAFGIKNLDVQVEINRVRPFTFSHNDTISNYTHYNQPLAHPLGANFQELITIINYHPFPKLKINSQVLYYYKGMDTANANFGGNIFRSYLTRISEDGFKIGGGNKAICLNAMLNISYEFKQQLFFEIGLQQRNYKLSSQDKPNQSTNISFGVRYNWYRRMYDF
jgi:hypothetical protein